MDKHINRNYYLDVVKGVAMFLVIFGHCILNGSGKEFIDSKLFWNDEIHKIIYSFHMPLFIAVGGYFLYFSINKYETKDLIIRKIKHIFPAIVFFNIYNYIILNTNINIAGDIKQDDITIILSLKKLIILIFGGYYWFLWAILSLSILVIIINKKFRDHLLVYVAGFLLSFIIPNKIVIFKMYTICFLYPFFVLGYLLAKNKEKVLNVVTKKQNLFLIVSGILFLMHIPFYNYYDYVYDTQFNILRTELGTTLKEQLFIDMFRLSIGIWGTAFILLAIYKIYSISKGLKVWNFFVYLSINSLGLYVLQEIVIIFIIKPNSLDLSPNYFINLIQSFITIAICSLIIEMMKKSSFLRKTHLGLPK